MCEQSNCVSLTALSLLSLQLSPVAAAIVSGRFCREREDMALCLVDLPILCSKRAFQTDEGDMLFCQNAGLTLLSDSCSLHPVHCCESPGQVVSALVAPLEKHSDGGGGEFADKVTASHAKASKPLGHFKSQ